MLSPSVWQSRTTSALNSAVNFLRGLRCFLFLDQPVLFVLGGADDALNWQSVSWRW